MNIIIFILATFTFSCLASSVPKKTRAYSKAHHRSTLQVYKSKGIHYSSSPQLGRGIASEKVKKIPWGTKSR